MTKSARHRESGESDPTITQRVRREQVISATVALVAEKGYAGLSLARVAERAGVTKPTVLYHFSGMADVVEAAYQHVLTALITDVAEAVDAAAVQDRPAAYARAMIGHLSEHRQHTRIIIEALSSGVGDYEPETRWRPVADLIAAARQARSANTDTAANTAAAAGPDVDAAKDTDPDAGPDDRTAALIVGGAIDAVVSEKFHDPSYDAAAAADRLATVIERSFL